MCSLVNSEANVTHDHTHDHTPAVTRQNERSILVSFVLIFSFMIVEVVGGVLSGSLALLADAGHMMTDAAALALAYLAFRFARRPPDARRTFGYLRFEVVAGFVNALTLFAIVIYIAYEAWNRLWQPHEVLAGPMLAVAVVGLIVNLVVLWILSRADTGHVNIRGAALHVMGDLLGSVGAIAAAVVIQITGWMPIDPILSVLVALLILRSAWGLMATSLHILIEGAPEHATPDMIGHHLRSNVAGVEEVRHIHVWSLSSGRTLATLHVRPDTDANAARVTRSVENALHDRFGIDHATVAVEWNAAEEPCCLDPEARAHHHAHV
ncbi:cation diffusion facilitator family transporter [Pelagibacterium montanilacus]|uniref:cation diffusion facilitator family transporter n=1 Tax=Pelagibacterium montanilacus TaxID=2185280 RepID=UPI000F8ED916|nr:cation diffusion facilitator family transporter [Pelagibacterium montanilacus]